MSEERPATYRQRPAREERLARAMRDNLKKRKAQQRFRRHEAELPSPADDEGGGRSG